MRRGKMPDVLKDIIRKNRGGLATAIPSVCSAHPDVIRASLLLAEAKNRPIVIEATSNQVNPDGGYTGKTARDFIAETLAMADAVGVDRNRIHFGGDHLGPQAWRSLDAEAAMAKAHEMVRDYVDAGFDKIHLDCSEGCLGEAAQLPDEITAQRSAELARSCLDVSENLLFVIGTEVPPPGGARTDEHGDIPPTTPESVTATLDAHRESFGAMVSKIGGLVVQPGVEFAPMHIHHFPMDRDIGLLAVLSDWPDICLEAHSTDYQKPSVYPRLAGLGFAFQKVGPALTFAYRQAVYALDHARELMGDGSLLPVVMERVMLDDPKHWTSHYSGADLRVQRHFGFADRIRYYWPRPEVQAALSTLLGDLPKDIPDPVLWQVFDGAVLDRADRLYGPLHERLITAQIQNALDPYFFDETGVQK